MHPDGDQWLLYRGDWQVGAYCPCDNVYRPLTPQGWGPVGNPPILPPAFDSARPVEASGDLLPKWAKDGVNRDLCDGKRERCSIQGQEISKRQLLLTLAGDGLPDDAKLPWIVYVGSDKAGAAKSLAEFSRKYRVQCYDPSDWQVPVCDLKPGVVVMKPDGKVLHESDKIDLDKIRRLDAAKPSPSPLPPPGGQSCRLSHWILTSLLVATWGYLLWKTR